MTKIAYLLPNTDLHGGNRVPMDQGTELKKRGYDVEIWSPSGPPDWHESAVRFVQADIFGGELPHPDVCIATFWPTVALACATGAARVFHLCQGFEGVHEEYAPQLPAIDRAYRMPARKLVISRHLADILYHRYRIRAHFIGSGIDMETFRPGPGAARSGALRIGVVGASELRPKGVREVLEGLGLARKQGWSFELWRASSTGFTDEERAAGLAARYCDRLSTMEMTWFYRSLDCLIHGSWDEEGFGLPPLEAAACGCAVAATDIAPMKAFPDNAILRFPAARPDVIPGVVERLMCRDTRRSLTSGFRAVISRYDIRGVVDRLEAALQVTRPSPAAP